MNRYRKWWFWTVLILGCLVIALSPLTTVGLIIVSLIWGLMWDEIAKVFV